MQSPAVAEPSLSCGGHSTEVKTQYIFSLLLNLYAPRGSNTTKYYDDHRGVQSFAQDAEITRCRFKESLTGSFKSCRKVRPSKC